MPQMMILILFISTISFFSGVCGHRDPSRSCITGCPATSDPHYQSGMRYTYRYSAGTTSSLPGSTTESSGLSIDCLLDIDMFPSCQFTMKLRNSQIKRVSPQKENSAQRMKNLREALERSPLLFSLQDGKVAHVCPREGEATWVLNIKRAILSMLQTSHNGEPQETVKETDVYGTCMSHYEQRGPLLLKIRDVQRCHGDKLAAFWLRSVPLSPDSEEAVVSRVQCMQCHGDVVMEEVNCTETVSLAPVARHPLGAQVQSISTLTLLRAQEVASAGPGAPVLSSNLRFEEESPGSGRPKVFETQESVDTVRRLCATRLDQQQQVDLFLQLVFQLRALSHQQLQDLWQEASFKCRDDWQPLVDALPACGSEACITLMTELLLAKELESKQASSFLSSFTFIHQASPSMLSIVNDLLKSPETRPGALLSVSSLVHTLCLMVTSPCSLMPQVQHFLGVLKEVLGDHCGVEGQLQFKEKLLVLKAVGNAGLAAATLTPQLTGCVENQSTPMELRLAAIQAFRRIPCAVDRRVLLRLFRLPQEDVEIRIAAYQQIMRCPDRNVLLKVRATLRDETSSQVGSYVWSHLTQIQKTDDPLKQPLAELLLDDVISKEYDGESWKYSSYMDATVHTDFGGVNAEGAVVFSPSSFMPRSAMANLTLHILGRAFNLLEIDVRAENTESLLKQFLGHKVPPSDKEAGTQPPSESSLREKRSDDGVGDADHPPADEEDDGGCWGDGPAHLREAKAKFAWHRPDSNRLHCDISAKVLGNELAFVTCDDLFTQAKELSLSFAELAVRLLKGQEVQLNRKAVLATEELVLPSLSGWPIKVAINMSAALSLRVKGSASLKSWSHFSIAGYIKPSAYVGVSARMGLGGVCGHVGVEWTLRLQSSTSLNGGVQLQRGQELKVSLNTPEDTTDIIHFSSRTYSVNGESKEEIKGSRDHKNRTTCTPQDWSKTLGWQLCSQVAYPFSPAGVGLPPAGPVQYSLRMLKLDRGLQQYLLEGAYSFLTQRGSWCPKEASLHVFLGTPQSTVPRDLSLDLTFSSINHRLALKISHPLKTIHFQGHIDKVKAMRSVKVELLVDSFYHYYVKLLTDVQALPTEQRLLCHLEAKVTTDGHPIILSANLTRGLGRKISVSAVLKNVFREAALLSVLIERVLEQEQKQYSVEAEILLPGLLGTQIFGLIHHGASLWNSAVRFRYGLRGDARTPRYECHTSQTVKSAGQPNRTHHIRAEHELHCSHIVTFNHKVQLKHQEGHGQVQSTLDVSYGKHWDEVNNKRRILLSQSFRNQSRHDLTSYFLEFSAQVLEKHLNYRTQLLHSHLWDNGVESSTHLKVNYNDQLPLVAGLHWRDSSKARLRRWEGTLNMDTPWLYLYTAHKLSQPQRRALQFSTEVTIRKWVTLRSLVLDGFFWEKGREREARLHLHTPMESYFKVNSWCLTGKRSLKASGSLSSAWTLTLRGDLSLESSTHRKSLQLASSYGRHNVSLAATLSTLDKRLRKRSVTVKMVLLEPKAAPVEFELEGGVEELKRDKDVYQKQGTLRFRQPFMHLPQNLILQETFTVDTRRALYILASRAILGENKECLHTLTLGYRLSSPFVCSALSHPFSTELVPRDSELCMMLHNNETQKEVQCVVRVNKMDRLIFLGQVRNTSDSSQQGFSLQVNMTQLLQLQMPPSVSLEGGLYWKPAHGYTFNYLARGKAVINHHEECQLSVQLNGSSTKIGLHSLFSHPYGSRIPKTFEAHGHAEVSAEGRAGSSVHVKANGEERVTLEADLFNILEDGTRLLGASATLHQRLVPVLQDLHLKLLANGSSNRLSAACVVEQAGGVLHAQLSGALGHGPELQVSMSGVLQHSLASLAALPQALGMEGALRKSEELTEGQLTVTTGKATYGVELSHQGALVSREPRAGEQPAQEALSDWGRLRLHVEGAGRSLTVNVNTSLGSPHKRGLQALISHTCPHLCAAGLPSDARMQAHWVRGDGDVSLVMEMWAGSESLQVEVNGSRKGQAPVRWELSSRLQHHSWALRERGVQGSMEAVGHCQVGLGAASTGLSIFTQGQAMLDMQVEAGISDDSTRLAVSLGHDIGSVAGILPSQLQSHLPQHFSVNGTLVSSGEGLHLRTQLEGRRGRMAALSLALSRSPQLHLQTSVQHTLSGLQQLGIPPHGSLSLSVQQGPRPEALLKLVLGQCQLSAQASVSSVPEETSSSWTANWTNHCLTLEHMGMPTLLEFSGLLSLTESQSAVSSNLQVDEEYLNLELDLTCQPVHHLKGALMHSFSQLRHKGLPPEIKLVISASEGPGQNGTFLLKLGSCQVKASSHIGHGGRGHWAWTTDTESPLLEFNGSVALDGCIMDTHLEGPRASLWLSARCHPELRVEGALWHDVPALQGLPRHSQLVVAGTAVHSRYGGELVLQMDSCALGMSGDVQTDSRLEGSLLMQNNCTALWDLGTPSRAEASGSLVTNEDTVDSRLSLVTDENKLQALLTTQVAGNHHEILAQMNHSMTLLQKAGVPYSTKLSYNSDRGVNSYYRTMSCSLTNQQISDELRIERTQGDVQLQYCLNHSIDFLRDWGMPCNNSIQAKLGFGEVKQLSVHSQLGAQLAHLGVQMKETPTGAEATGLVEHNWPWLESQGFPKTLEVLCSVLGYFPQLQSRAHLSVDGDKLLASALNMSVVGGHLAVLMSLTTPPRLAPGLPRSLDTTLTAQYQGSQKYVSMDLYCDGTRVRFSGETCTWGTRGQEARATFQHITVGEDMPGVQLEAWAGLTDSHLRSSLAVKSKANSSLAVTLQGHSLSDRKEFNVKLHQNMPVLHQYLPSQFDTTTQVNHTNSTLWGLAKVRTGSSKLRALCQLTLTGHGYSQAVELNHSFPQLRFLPKNITVRMMYEGGNWTGKLRQEVTWGDHKFKVSGEHSVPSDQERGTHRLHVHTYSSFPTLPRECGLDIQRERSPHRQMDSFLLNWKGQAKNEKVRALCSWSGEADLWEGRLDLRQPSTQPLSHLHLHAISRSAAGGQGNSHQAQLSWNDGQPLNFTVTVNRHWHGMSSRGQACLSLSPGQMQAVLPLVEMEGCGTLAKEGNAYSQTAELKWGDKRITQGMKYQRGPRGVHTLQLEVGAKNVSPRPCPSHTFLAQVHTNGQDQLEHHLLLGLCPPHPAWAVSGYHRAGTARELLHTHTRLSVSGKPHVSSFTLAVTNDSTPQHSNLSVHTELQVGNGTLELVGSALSSRQGFGLLMQARLDRKEYVWLQGALEERCLQAATGYSNGMSSHDDVTVALCLEGRRHVMLKAWRREGEARQERLASVTVRAANHSLMLNTHGCAESLRAAETRVRVLGSHIRSKLLEKIQVLQRLLVEFRHQSRDSVLLQEMIETPLQVTQRAEALLVQGLGGIWTAWRRGFLRRSLTEMLPHYLATLQQVSLQVQQELKRPLATLAEAYQDVTGRKLDVAWREGVALWTQRLVELLPTVLEERLQGAPMKTVLGMLTSVLDMVSQQTVWRLEARLAAALAGVRRRLYSLYKFSHSQCDLTVRVPLPRGVWSDVRGAGLMEFLLEEWLLKPVVALTSIKPTAELYRLKRKMMDSPFGYQALLVSDQFVVSFDGRLYQLPSHCTLLMARDIAGDSFVMLLSPNKESQRTLVVEMINTTVSIPFDGQVEVNCHMTDKSSTDNSVNVRTDHGFVEMSSQNGVLVSCDLLQGICSLTLDSWHHGVSVGLLGTNDNEAGNELMLPDGSFAESEDHFTHSWQVHPQCRSDLRKTSSCSNASESELTSSSAACDSLFQTPDSPLAACFRVVDPLQFLTVCQMSRCNADSVPCRLAAAFVHLCHRNYVPLELPQECAHV